MREALRETAQNALAYDAVLQLATGLAIVVYFFPDLSRLFTVFLRMVGGMATEANDKALVIAVMVGTIPALILGIFLEELMETAFRSPLLVAFVLVAGSCLLAYAEFHSGMRANENIQKGDISISPKRGLLIGCFQALALIPGMSRSGATIAGGLILGLTRYEATRFSFLLAVPIILGSGGKKLLELLANESLVALTPMLIGAGTAFMVGLIAIHFMLIFVRTHSLWPFIWYRIALALVVVFSVLNA
jgi:undecaprenyl-diphosphatase